ncbi:SDR family oxidoreductase [Roseisalinus antarcticus]|uniref:3-oxoacyl-[acyl-carrier-protein] reductase FabG n=1 Tax=Roseisalinus antarcticus TaxID=254357 RepID=A0A1Y5RRE8_9RHOB|nr:SDR family oxidoreductase [Roseisalinus antarcticus]SLN23673.1 3-oxoacyl-[acyl-carrier-protein] reductase FabG [Roseisalinus antarcticus]
MKTAIVTGASSGIGRAVALSLLDAGWTVGLLARREEALQALAKGRDAVVLPADVTDTAQVEAAFSDFASHTGRLDFLFNNAGIFTPPAPIDEIPVEDWMQAVGVNLTGMFLCARAAFGIMRRQAPMGGRIVNNGSVSADRPREGSVTYTATKHGVTGLTKTLALDGRAFDIAAGQIDIGNAETEMVAMLKERAEAAGQPAPPTMDVQHVADAVMAMAELPLSANVLFQTLMATKMPLIGRG